MSTSASLTLSHLSARAESDRLHRDLCRFHPLVKMVQKAIETGELPVDGMAPKDTLYYHRGQGFFSFKALGAHATPDTVYLTAEVSVGCEESGEEVNRLVYYHIPAALLTDKPDPKAFNAWTKLRREKWAESREADAEEAVALAKAARAAVKHPIAPGHSSPDW